MIVSGRPKARSPQCAGGIVTLQGIQPCAKCSQLTLDVKIIRERATRSFEHIRNHDDLSSDQLRAKVTVVKDKVNALKLKILDLEDSLRRAQARLSEWRELFHFIGQNSGGGGATYTINHSIFALPSRNTIQPYRRLFNLAPCISGTRFTEISRNITTLFGPRTRNDGEVELLPPVKCGHTLSLDEVAADRRIEWMQETDEMGGFCLEHVSELETVKIGDDLQTVEAAVAAVKEGKVHVAHEICVAAILHLYGTDYGAKYMGPTCKKGPWQDQVRLIEVIIEAWKRSPDGEAKHGKMLSVSTDGDHKRRLALFLLCMGFEIVPGNPLWTYVCNLPGLNLRVGKDNLTNDGDPKHIFKRKHTNKSELGDAGTDLIAQSVIINRDLLLGRLERLPDQDWSETSIHSLLHPSDGQNFSNAIKLMLCIVEIAKLDKEDFDPGEMAEFEALCLLGEAYDALLQPFINVELTLSEQIQSLVTASHLFCALYLQNTTSFMSNQLYADMQSMFKNAVLMVPKTRVINRQLKVYICLLGDDVLETLFGRCRMLGGHSPNCSVGILRDRISSAMNLDNIYERHPELERQPRRLSMLRKRHVDHLRPPHFKRELRADSCDLEKCWAAAVKTAETILAKHNLRMTMTFAERFKRKDTDLSRPLGGKYPAISGGVDRSMSYISSDESDAENLIDPDTVNFLNLVAGVDIDAMVASESISSPSPSTPPSLFAKVDTAGNLVHKVSALRELFDMTADGHVSHDRLQRVRGYTIGGKSWPREIQQTHSISDATHFQLGNLFTTLLSHNNTHLGLAVARCTLIKNTPSGAKPTSVAAIPRAEMHLPTSIYTISGQVLSLSLLAGSHPDNATWAWDGQFISLSLKKRKSTGEEVTRRENLQVIVSGRLVDFNIQDQAQDISTIDLPGGLEKTWRFHNADLTSSWNFVWTTLLNDTTLHDKFPIFTGVSQGSFPYQAEPLGINYAAPIAGTTIADSIAKRQTCRICGKAIKDPDRQQHVGQHIIKTMYNVEDTSAKNMVLKSCPCDCKEIHWKYNFRQHLEERHPDWQKLVPKTFLPEIQISREELLELKIPTQAAIGWPPPAVPPASPLTLTSRNQSETSRSPSRRRRDVDKENRDPNDDRHAKKRRIN
ncbi:hypothetical protein R3P38DRAFT_2806576 [Favolaschia claudopus]|uniref:C2H2-type domain-containing protein n=1 Tax=Favolaschia claudopus TaxID=2862362 RepID=A0AAV9ZJK7_9AGAR